MDEVSRPDHRQLVLYERWTLRAGASVDDVAALVREHIAPAYRRLSPEVTLHLEVALDKRSIVAIQPIEPRPTTSEPRRARDTRR